MLKLYNTLTKKIEIVPRSDHTNLYTCGPTVYNYAHIGNMRAYISADFLYRALKYEGYNPRWVMNITDVDDKTIRDTIKKYGSAATVSQLKDFTTEYFNAFIKDLKAVNASVEEITFIRVSDVIPQIQQFIVDLIKKGYAYTTDDGIYFGIEKYQKDFGDYGALVGEKFIEGKKVGARVKVDEYEKDNLSDFALWKSHNPETDGNIFWEDLIKDSEVLIPNGRPGWHIECSVINNVGFKGEVVDIHTGGVDLIFPHHTNEIAQSQALFGKGNFVHAWCHSDHILVDGKRMAKRENNFYTIKDLAKKVPLPGLALRYLFAQSGYRSQQNFTIESFLGAYKALEKLYNILKSHSIIGHNQVLQKEFISHYKATFFAEDGNGMSNDLNIPAALAVVWEMLANKNIDIHTQDALVNEFDQILGMSLSHIPSIAESIELPEGIKMILDKRVKAREKKDFASSDVLRQQIEELGYSVLDTPEGQKVKKNVGA